LSVKKIINEIIFILSTGIIFLNKEEAIQASIKYTKSRIEIFNKNNELGYSPTYSYYQSGKLYTNNNQIGENPDLF
jgi:hypothetical protein